MDLQTRNRVLCNLELNASNIHTDGETVFGRFVDYKFCATKILKVSSPDFSCFLN